MILFIKGNLRKICLMACFCLSIKFAFSVTLSEIESELMIISKLSEFNEEVSRDYLRMGPDVVPIIIK